MAEKDTKGGRISLFESLYKRYSQLNFTNDHDRPMAIAGLERRLCHAFDTDGGFGVFHRYLERSILWQRAVTQADSLTKIKFRPGQAHVPSWSWMAYRGSIEYPSQTDLPFDGIDWVEDEYRSPWTTASTTSARDTRSIRDRSNSVLKVVARNFHLESTDHDNQARSWIIWDREDMVDDGPKCCAIIGKLRGEARSSSQKHYVLILRPTDRAKIFERVGVGCIAKERIDLGGERIWSLVE